MIPKGLITPPPADEPRILLYDIETMASLVWVWKQWKTSVIATEADWYMLCFSYRWLGQDQAGFVSIFQDRTFTPDCGNDRYVAERLAALFDQADCTVAHNGDRFDRPRANSRFLYHGIDPPSPYQTVDTLKETRRHFSNYSNRLDELGRLYGIGRKKEHRGWPLWRECALGNPGTWLEMEEYCRQDLDLLEGWYLRILPWIGTPGAGGGGINRALWTSDPDVDTCPKCGSHHLEHRGRHRTRFSVFQTLHCMDCGGWSRKPFREKGHATAI